MNSNLKLTVTLKYRDQNDVFAYFLILNILFFYNNPQFLLFSFVFLKTFLSFQTLFLATQQSKTNGPFGLRGREGEQNRVKQIQHKINLFLANSTLLYSPPLLLLHPSIQTGHKQLPKQVRTSMDFISSSSLLESKVTFSSEDFIASPTSSASLTRLFFTAT